MVKVGFIVEGTSDLIILKSEKFKELFSQLGIETNGDLIKNGRSKSGLKEQLVPFIQQLDDLKCDYVFILFDLDDKKNEKKTKSKKKIKDCPVGAVEEVKKFGDNKNYLKDNQIFVVMVREMEAWFLADEELGYTYENDDPEEVKNPSEIIEKAENSKNHILLANRVVKKKFSLERAAKNSSSAKRFLTKLKFVNKIRNMFSKKK